MNQKEWKNSSNFKGKWFWKNKANELLRSRVYNQDPDAKIVHHLRDTEEQRVYNDTYYEFWGFNQDGTFEYGKYVIFVTKEWHDNYHTQSEETRARNSAAVKASITPERRARMREVQLGCKNSMYGKKGELAPCYGRCGELHPMYGKCHTDEALNKISSTMNVLTSQYYNYKNSGGTLKWCEFLKALSAYKKETHTNSNTVDYAAFIQSLN